MFWMRFKNKAWTYGKLGTRVLSDLIVKNTEVCAIESLDSSMVPNFHIVLKNGRMYGVEGDMREFALWLETKECSYIAGIHEWMKGS